MERRLQNVESTVRDLEHAVRTLERRLSALEHHSVPLTTAVVDAPAAAPRAIPSVGRDDFVTILSYAGRSCVGLGGAYLLRALTEAAILRYPVGVALGLCYGLSWLVFADRAAGSGAKLNAVFHALVGAMIAYPILWEAAVKFRVIEPPVAATALAVMTALALLVPMRRGLQLLAWIPTIAGVVTAMALIAATGVLMPSALFLIACGIATLWLGYTYDWILLRWPVALAADVVVLALTMRVSSKGWGEAPLTVVGIQLLLLNAYVGSIAVRTLVKARDVNAFEVVQTIAALAVGFGGAVYIAYSTGAGVMVLALVNLAAGVGCYGVAFWFIAQRQGLHRNFYFYTSLGAILLLVSTGLLLEGAALVLTWLALAVASTAVAERTDRVSLAWHGFVYLLAAAINGKVLQASADAFAGSVASPWQPFTTISLAVMVAAAICWTVGATAGRDSIAFRVPRFLVLVLLVASIGGGVVALATPALCGVPGSGADPGPLATIRTTVLASAALALAWIGRRPRVHEAAWLLYPLLVAGAIKLLVEDLPQSRPATLFVALLFYGGALIVAPRLTHKTV